MVHNDEETVGGFLDKSFKYGRMYSDSISSI